MLTHPFTGELVHYPVVAICSSINGPFTLTPDGYYNEVDTPTWRDLIKPWVEKTHLDPEKRQPVEFWINKYADGSNACYDSLEAADKWAGRHRIRCIHMREVIEEDE